MGEVTEYSNHGTHHDHTTIKCIKHARSMQIIPEISVSSTFVHHTEIYT